MINIYKKYNFIYFLVLCIFFGISFYYSKEYTTYHTDFIHWSFILEQITSYINGRELYKDIFLQYGEGQIVFLAFINNFYKIDIYSIGIISSLIYSLKFFLIFHILTLIIRSKKLALICTSLIFFSITYSQVPWPDLYAGLFLLIFFYLFLYNFKKRNLFLLLLTSFIFFLTIYFRNTYLLNFLLSVICYFFYEKIFIKKTNIYIYKIFSITFFFILTYFLILFINDNLYLWFEQGFGLSDRHFGVADADLDVRIKSYFFYIARFFYHLVIPKNFVNLLFTICVLFNLIYLFFGNFLIEKNNKDENSLIQFLCIYGLCGLIQLTGHYEIVRYVNASVSAYLILFYFIDKTNIISIKKKYVLTLSFSLIYLFNVISFFPLSSHNHKTANFPLNSYTESDINYFGKKKLYKTYLNFYKDIIYEICSKEHIYNLSYDKTFSYICDDKKIIYKYHIFLGDRNLMNNLIKGENKNNRIILSSTKLKDLNLIDIKKLPKFFRYTKSDTYMQFLPDEIYLYE